MIEWRLYKRAEKYSLGLNYIHAAVKAAGFAVRTLVFEDVSIAAACETIIGLDPDVLGIKFYSETASPVFEIARSVRKAKPDTTIVIGGHTATLYAALILQQEPAIDVVVCGEGEATFTELCERIEAGDGLSGCAGIIYRKASHIYRNRHRSLIPDLDELNAPESSVFTGSNGASQYVNYAISTSRGCTGDCYFCVVNRVYEENGRRRWRGMSPEKIVAAISDAASSHADKKINVRFVDSAFEDPEPASKTRLIRIVDLLEEKKTGIAFSFFTRSESWHEKDEGLIRRMRRLGLYKVSLGYDESASRLSIDEFMLRAISRENYEVARLFARNGIRTYGYLILFHPYMTLDLLGAYGDFLDKAGMSPYPDSWSHELILYPDTKLFNNVVGDGLLLGSDPGGYSFRYAYKDGRVKKVHESIKKVKELKSYLDIRSSIMKIDTDFDTFGAWKDRTDNLRGIEGEMKAYADDIRPLYDELGKRQNELFRASIDIARTTGSGRDLVPEWDKVYSDIHAELEKTWMKNQLRVGRKKVRLH